VRSATPLSARAVDQSPDSFAAFQHTLVITGKVITLEMGPGSQKAKNTIGPDLKSFLGISLSALNSNIDHQFPGHFWIITQNNLK
jgi:hypothetical protein